MARNASTSAAAAERRGTPNTMLVVQFSSFCFFSFLYSSILFCRFIISTVFVLAVAWCVCVCVRYTVQRL